VGSSPTSGTKIAFWQTQIVYPYEVRMALKKESEETRGKQRVTTVLPVDCKVVSLPVFRSSVSMLKPGQTFGGRTINVSESGLLINSDFELEEGTTLEVLLVFDHHGHKKHIRLMAEVIRSRRNAYDLYGRWAMGMKVLEIKDKDFDFLTNLFTESGNTAPRVLSSLPRRGRIQTRARLVR
jgi:hypothetical protein